MLSCNSLLYLSIQHQTSPEVSVYLGDRPWPPPASPPRPPSRASPTSGPAFPRSSDIIARYGGEEFAIILPGTELEYALQVTERMRSQLESKQMAVSESGQQIGKVTASFGVAELTAGDSSDDLVHRADAKLYEAKKKTLDGFDEFVQTSGRKIGQ